MTGQKFVIMTPHPAWRWIRNFGSNLRIFNCDANEEHKTFFDRLTMALLGRELNLIITYPDVFLFGVNQPFILSELFVA